MTVDDILSVHEMVLEGVEYPLIFQSEEFQRIKKDCSGSDVDILKTIVVRASVILSES